ncbi:hypothetical protein ACFE04_022591 [Oxalis oulophora]
MVIVYPYIWIFVQWNGSPAGSGYKSLPQLMNCKAVEQSAAEIALIELRKSGQNHETNTHPLEEAKRDQPMLFEDKDEDKSMLFQSEDLVDKFKKRFPKT